VIGQPNLYTNAANHGGISGDRLYGPAGLISSDDSLYITEYRNHRILVLPAGNVARAPATW
jgi:hypothetical protein